MGQTYGFLETLYWGERGVHHLATWRLNIWGGGGGYAEGGEEESGLVGTEMWEGGGGGGYVGTICGTRIGLGSCYIVPVGFFMKSGGGGGI